MPSILVPTPIATIIILCYRYIQGGAVNRGLKPFFSKYRPHVLLKLILGLKSNVLCGLDPWLTIYSILTSFFLATAAERAACFVDLDRR
jgi:hypothetical protein